MELFKCIKCGSVSRLEILIVCGECASKINGPAPSASTNTQSAAIAKIAAELEDGVRIANIGGVPSVEQLSTWARQLRAL